MAFLCLLTKSAESVCAVAMRGVARRVIEDWKVEVQRLMLIEFEELYDDVVQREIRVAEEERWFKTTLECWGC
jgi:hypothetical protein